MSSKSIQSILAAAALAATTGCRVAYEEATHQMRKWNDRVVETELGEGLSDVVDKHFDPFTQKTVDFSTINKKESRPVVPEVWQTYLEDAIKAENAKIEEENKKIQEHNKALKNSIKWEKPHELKPVEVTYDTFIKEFSTLLENTFKAGKITAPAYDAAKEFIKHNDELHTIMRRFRLQRYVLSVAYENTAADINMFTLGRLESASNPAAFRRNVEEWIQDFDKSVRDLTYAERSTLEKTFSDEKLDEKLRTGYRSLQTFNADATQAVRQLYVVADSLAALEAHYDLRHRLERYGSNIVKSLTDIDQYKQGQVVLDTILTRLTIKDVARPGSQLHDAFDPETSLGDVYQQLLKEVRDEAKDPAWHTRDDIAQGPGYQLVNMVAQAAASGYFKTKNTNGDHLFIAARNKVIEDIVDATSNTPLEANPNYWHILGDLFIPLYGGVRAMSNADWAFKSNWVDLETEEGRRALKNAIHIGSLKANGGENYPYIVGDNTSARVAVFTGTLGTLAQAGAALGIIYGVNTSSSSSTPASTPATPPVSGGGTIFNPTGN